MNREQMCEPEDYGDPDKMPFFDIRLTNTNSDSQSHLSSDKILRKHQQEKKRETLKGRLPRRLFKLKANQNTKLHKTRDANRAFETQSYGEVKQINEEIKQHLNEIDISQKFEKFESKQKSNIQFVWIHTYMKMVERLLLFRHAVRSRDWLLHLKSTEDIIEDVVSMDRIKYRRMLPVYLADMKHLESEEPTIWNSFLQGNFAVKKSDISFTPLGADHAGEQQNKLLKIQGGIVGITKNEHARIRYFLTASILANISSELKNIISTNSYTCHHKLNNAAISKQAKMMNSLRKTLDERRFSVESTEENKMFNNITKHWSNQRNSTMMSCQCQTKGSRFMNSFVRNDYKAHPPLEFGNQ